MPTSYADVYDMLRNTLPENGDALAKEIENTVKGYSLGETLIRTRLKAGLTQKQIADKLHCSQSRISKIECAHNDDIHMSDFGKYIGVCGYELSLMVNQRTKCASSAVKHHAIAMGRALDKLAELATKDEEIAEAIRSFHSELLFNLGRIVERWTDKIYPEGLPESHVDTMDDDTGTTRIFFEQDLPGNKHNDKAIA